MISPLDGHWELIRAEMNGETAPELVEMGVRLEISAGVYIVRFAGEIADRGSFEMAPVSEAKTFVIHGEEGPNAGRTIPCLYQQVGERLRVSYGLDGVPPTGFATTIGQPVYVATYRRSSSPDTAAR